MCTATSQCHCDVFTASNLHVNCGMLVQDCSVGGDIDCIFLKTILTGIISKSFSLKAQGHRMIHSFSSVVAWVYIV